MMAVDLPMNRAQRRAMEKAARRAPTPSRELVPTINPLFALGSEARNVMAVQERRAMDALLEHRATDDDLGNIQSVLEASIRAIRIAQEEELPHLDASALAQALKVFYRAVWAIRFAQRRYATTGVYGLDAADRQALMMVDELVCEMRKPKVILRKTWMAALREAAFSREGVELPPIEECTL